MFKNYLNYLFQTLKCSHPDKGTFPAISIMECMIDHLANSINADPLKIRQLNLYTKNDTTPLGQPLTYFNVDTLIETLKVSSDYENRVKLVNDFNKANRWKKKGISMTPIKWVVDWNYAANYNCMVNIYAPDGSVSLINGGVELGQGKVK